MGPGPPRGSCWQRLQGFPAGPRASCTARPSPRSEPPGAFHLWERERSRLDCWVTFDVGFKFPVAGSFSLRTCSHFHKRSNRGPATSTRKSSAISPQGAHGLYFPPSAPALYLGHV